MTFKEVCVKLGLSNTSDWGIINSDGSRVEEFIDFVNLYELSLSKGTQFEFLELIIASMNDAIVDNKSSECMEQKFYNYIKPKIEDNRFYPIIPYWTSIKSKDEFPVGYLIESYSIKRC